MKRRTFLQTASTALGAAALGGAALPDDASGTPAPRVGAPPAVKDQTAPDVVVVGAGAFGGWTALSLLQQGASVTLVDEYGPGNYRATSSGDSRQIRAGYGDREVYTRWVLEAWEAWRRWQEEWGETLLVPCGRISFAPEKTASMEAEARILDAHEVENEFLTPDEIRRRWPQFGLEGVGIGHYENGAATIPAARAMRRVGREIQDRGGELVVARAEPGPSRGGRMTGIRLTDESGTRVLQADQYVFACGPWLPQVFPDLVGPWTSLDAKITVPRRDVYCFGPPPGDDRFGVGRLPNFSESGVYGFPDFEGKGVKVAPYGGSDPFDPDVDERIVTAHWMKRARDWVRVRIPDLALQPVIHTRVCQLENTADEHFLIDRHPEMSNVLLAGGGSGHAFKHGPKLGQYVAGRVLEGRGDPELARLFSLARDRSE